MGTRKRDRLYYREGRGWYADLRDYGDVGGKREAVIPFRRRYATHDRDEASRILVDRLAELDALRQGIGQEVPSPTVEEYARRHLELKALNRAPSTVARDERSLSKILSGLPAGVKLTDITVPRLSDHVRKRSREVKAQTILHELHALSSLLKRAVSEGLVPFNPVTQLVDKPRVEREEAVWLEPGEGARLIEKAAGGACLTHVLIATFLLTGGRWGEVMGLEVEDIDFEHNKVHFHANQWRTLKRRHHARRVPLWPQLETILRAYVTTFERERGLLFPSARGDMFRDLRASRDKAVGAAKIRKHITWHTFRHTYGAMRMQTTDHGAPVSPYTVMRELGHRSIALVENTYGHLMDRPHRSAAVEYRRVDVIDLVGVRQA